VTYINGSFASAALRGSRLFGTPSCIYSGDAQTHRLLRAEMLQLLSWAGTVIVDVYAQASNSEQRALRESQQLYNFRDQITHTDLTYTALYERTKIQLLVIKLCRSRRPCCLRCRCEAGRLLGSRFRIPLRAWMFVSCVCCVSCR
jgi:hypothetical protein